MPFVGFTLATQTPACSVDIKYFHTNKRIVVGSVELGGTDTHVLLLLLCMLVYDVAVVQIMCMYLCGFGSMYDVLWVPASVVALVYGLVVFLWAVTCSPRWTRSVQFDNTAHGKPTTSNLQLKE